jgi:hypothetical protein
LGVQMIDEATDEVTHGVAPIMLARAANKVASRVMHPSPHFTLPATAMHGDGKCELSDPFTHLHGPAKPGHELLAM